MDDPKWPDSNEQRNIRKTNFDEALDDVVKALALAKFVLSNTAIARDVFFATDDSNDDRLEAILATAASCMPENLWTTPTRQRFIRVLAIEMATGSWRKES